jgi:hypothetical protein
MITTIFAAVFFSYYFVNIAGIPNKIKRILKFKAGKRLKPFDCVTCLSAWSALALFFLPDFYSQLFCVMFVSGYIGSKMK